MLSQKLWLILSGFYCKSWIRDTKIHCKRLLWNVQLVQIPLNSICGAEIKLQLVILKPTTATVYRT